MTTRRTSASDKAARLAARREPAAAVVEPAGEAPAERPATRPSEVGEASTRMVRVSVDLVQPMYEGLGDWNRAAARQLGRGRVTNVDTVRALVRRLLSDDELAAAVLADLKARQ